MTGLFERTLLSVMPAWAERRALARARISALETATALYEGAAQSWRTNGWRTANTSANAEIQVSLARLRGVSRDLRRNNATAANCVTVIGSNVVGSGIMPTFDIKRKRVATAFAALVKAHLETPAIDFDGRHDYYGLQRLAIDTVVDSGEALIVRYVPPVRLRLAVPLQVRVLDPDFLDTSKSGPLSDGGAVFEGIEVDAFGRRVAYWLFDEHPGGGLTWKLPASRRVPAGDVIHVYRQDRPGQMRGVPWCAPVIVTMRDLHDYEDADLVRQKIAACFAVFLKGADQARNLGQLVDGQKSRVGNIVEKLEPGLIQRLPDGVEATFATPPTVSGQNDFVISKLHRICSGYGVPFELATGILKEVSFISGRIGKQQFNLNVDQWRWHMMIPHVCDGIVGWFKEAAAISIGASLDDVTVKHTPPKREMLEPSKEVPAMRDAIRSGLMSQSEAIRSLGDDPAIVFAEIADDNKEMDRLGIMTDSDARRPPNWKPEQPEKK